MNIANHSVGNQLFYVVLRCPVHLRLVVPMSFSIVLADQLELPTDVLEAIGKQAILLTRIALLLLVLDHILFVLHYFGGL